MKKIVPADANLIPDDAMCVFRGILYDVYQWEQQLFDGSYQTYENLRRIDTAIAIAIVDDKVIIVNDQQPSRPPKLQLPGGRIDQGDTSTLQTVQREVREETGYSFENWKLIHVEKPQAKLEWFIHTYVAYGKYEVGPQNVDAGSEKISVHLMSLEAARKRADADSIDLFEELYPVRRAESLDDIIKMPEFVGIEIER